MSANLQTRKDPGVALTTLGVTEPKLEDSI